MPISAPSASPPAIAHTTSTAHQRQPQSPNSCRPSRPKPSITIGKAVPSLRPPSPVRPNRRLSRSLALATCTSEASTGSVGAKIAPSSTAAPSGRFSSQTPMAVTAATVTSIDTDASCTGMRQRLSCSGSSSFIPAVNSDTSTAISVRRSSSVTFCSASSCSRLMPHGPIAMPTTR